MDAKLVARSPGTSELDVPQLEQLTDLVADERHVDR
jgi:hypothetical protein